MYLFALPEILDRSPRLPYHIIRSCVMLLCFWKDDLGQPSHLQGGGRKGEFWTHIGKIAGASTRVDHGEFHHFYAASIWTIQGNPAASMRFPASAVATVNADSGVSDSCCHAGCECMSLRLEQPPNLGSMGSKRSLCSSALTMGSGGSAVAPDEAMAHVSSRPNREKQFKQVKRLPERPVQSRQPSLELTPRLQQGKPPRSRPDKESHQLPQGRSGSHRPSLNKPVEPAPKAQVHLPKGQASKPERNKEANRLLGRHTGSHAPSSNKPVEQQAQKEQAKQPEVDTEVDPLLGRRTGIRASRLNTPVEPVPKASLAVRASAQYKEISQLPKNRWGNRDQSGDAATVGIPKSQMHRAGRQEVSYKEIHSLPDRPDRLSMSLNASWNPAVDAMPTVERLAEASRQEISRLPERRSADTDQSSTAPIEAMPTLDMPDKSSYEDFRRELLRERGLRPGRNRSSLSCCDWSNFL